MVAAKCSGSSALTSSLRPVGMIDHQAPRMEVHLAADPDAGEERVVPAVLAVADDRVADRRHVDAQLVGAAGERLEFDPRGAAAWRGRPRDRRYARAGRLPSSTCIFSPPVPGCLAIGASIVPSRGIGHADHQRPVDLLGRAAREALGEERRAAGRAGDEQRRRRYPCRAGGPGARARLPRRVDEGIEQAVDVVVGLGAALRGEAWAAC